MGGGIRPMTRCLNHGRAMTECCSPNNDTSSRSMSAASTGGCNEAAPSTVGNGHQLTTWRGSARKMTKHTQKHHMMPKPAQAQASAKLGCSCVEGASETIDLETNRWLPGSQFRG